MADSKEGSSKKSPLKRSADPYEEPGQCSPPKQSRVGDLKFPTPDISPQSSPRRKVDSVFANIVPRMSTDEIKELMYEEFLRLYHRRIIDASMLEAGAIMNSQTFMHIASIVMKKRDADLRDLYTSFLNEKLLEQREELIKEADEEISRMFEDADDPSYVG